MKILHFTVHKGCSVHVVGSESQLTILSCIFSLSFLLFLSLLSLWVLFPVHLYHPLLDLKKITVGPFDSNSNMDFL